MPEVRAIVLAAGLSSRMGGPNKLLLPWEDTTVIGSVVRTLAKCQVETVVVTGRDCDLVAQAALPARSIFNPSYQMGLGSSLAFGVSAAGGCDGYLVCLGDMPGLRADVIEDLIECFNRSSSSSIVAPLYEEQPERLGHPVLFGSAFRQDLIMLRGDQGAKSVLAEHEESLISVRVSGDLKDIDSPSDLQ